MGKDTFIGKNKRPWPNKRLKRAAIVGHTNASSTRLWFRTASEGKFTALIYERPEKGDGIYENFNNDPYSLDDLPGDVRQETFSINNWDTDSTHVLDIDNLKPGTEYGYALYSESAKKIILGHDKPHFFRTMLENDKSFSFAFYSCHMPYKKTYFNRTKLKNEEMWDFFLAALERHYKHDLRFVIGGGDQAYCDGVETLSVWEFLNSRLRKDPQTGELLPTEEDMLSWYRDMYRGYWGFESVRAVFSTFPTYMMWDDHELCDGWGSYFTKDEKDLYSILPKLKDKALTLDDGKEIMNMMGRAAKQAYMEYQHSHNPKTDPGKWDYHFYHGDCAFYLLDGRGYRDVNRDSYRILGKEQFDRFENWLKSDETKNKQFLFVLAAVPVFHLRPAFPNMDQTFFAEYMTIGDDMRDSWEHNLHDEERKELCDLLFAASERGQKVVILSGDVHMAAAFKVKNREGSIIYQLTSSAITYHNTLPSGLALGVSVLPETGTLEGGMSFERLGMWTQSNFSRICVNPDDGKVEFRLYTAQVMEPMMGGKGEWIASKQPNAVKPGEGVPITHSLPKIVLDFT